MEGFPQHPEAESEANNEAKIEAIKSEERQAALKAITSSMSKSSENLFRFKGFLSQRSGDELDELFEDGGRPMYNSVSLFE